MKKDIKIWFSRLTRTGKILLYSAAVGLFWLLLGLINNIFNLVELDGVFRIIVIILNVIAILLIIFVFMQAAAVIYMMREENEMYRTMMTKGRRGGNSMEQVGGRRSQASMTKRGSQAQAFSTGFLTVENINQKYPARWYKKPALIADWKEIKEAGLFALEADPKTKVEIIDATELGGGYFVGTWEGNRFAKYKRILVLNKRTGRPLSYSSLRNAKKKISKVI